MYRSKFMHKKKVIPQCQIKRSVSSIKKLNHNCFIIILVGPRCDLYDLYKINF